jgi:uncharacterized protein with FMN-binding domain
MRRVIVILAATAAGLGLLLSFKTTALRSPASAPQGATASATTEPRRSSGPATRSVTGPVVDTRWGPVQVQVTMADDRLGDVRAVQLPSHLALSQQISTYVAPILRKETLDAQSAQIDVVSGATYTTEGYRQSLQAVLDAANG